MSKQMLLGKVRSEDAKNITCFEKNSYVNKLKASVQNFINQLWLQ